MRRTRFGYKGWLRMLCALFAPSVCGTAHAANVIDQNAPVATSFMAGLNKPDLAQSFKQSADNISGAGVLLQRSLGTTGTVNIALWTNLPDETGALELTKGSALGVAGAWADIFWDPIPITPHKTYYLVFSGTPTLGLAGDGNNGYALGLVFANSGYLPYVNYDYAFRTYSFIPDIVPVVSSPAPEDPVPTIPPLTGMGPSASGLELSNGTPVSAAPDAAGWLTMILGFGVAGGALRRSPRGAAAA